MLRANIQLLSGDALSVPLDSREPVKALRAELERNFGSSAFCEYSLVQLAASEPRTLQDGDDIVVELQACRVVSLPKLLASVEEAERERPRRPVPAETVGAWADALERLGALEPGAEASRLPRALTKLAAHGHLDEGAAERLGGALGGALVAGAATQLVDQFFEHFNAYVGFRDSHYILFIHAVREIADTDVELLRQRCEIVSGVLVRYFDDAAALPSSTLSTAACVLTRLGDHQTIADLQAAFGRLRPKAAASATPHVEAAIQGIRTRLTLPTSAPRAEAEAAPAEPEQRQEAEGLSRAPVADDGVQHGGARQDEESFKESKYEEENQDALMKGILASKHTIPLTGLPLNQDGVVMMMLKQQGRSERLKQHLLNAPQLAPYVQMVEEAGCSVILPFADEALAFVPLTPEHLAESELEPRFYHIFILNSGVERLRSALKDFQGVSAKKRKAPPVVRAADFQYLQHGEHCTPPASVQGTSVSAMSHGSSSSALQNGFEAESGEQYDEDEELYEVELVGILAVRTHSDVGFPVHPDV